MLILSVLLKSNKIMLPTAQTSEYQILNAKFEKKKRTYKLIIYSNIQNLGLNWATEVQFNNWCISQTALQASNCVMSPL